MKNLAGDKGCDRFIADELRKARIEAVPCQRSTDEVPAAIEGRLGPFRFTRAWYYWRVYGPMPLGAARTLYADPVGATDIRVAGHCGCPPPDEWVTRRAVDGREVIDSAQRPEMDALTSRHPELKARADADYAWDDEPGIRYVHLIESYHVDSEVGLRLLADTIRANFDVTA